MLQRIDNKFYTWDEAAGKYPDKWVVFENAKLTPGHFIIEGELIAVGNKKEIDDFVVDCYNDNREVSRQRTTEIGSVGVVYVKDFGIRAE